MVGPFLNGSPIKAKPKEVKSNKSEAQNSEESGKKFSFNFSFLQNLVTVLGFGLAEKKMDIALFSPSSLFAEDDDGSTDEEAIENCNSYVERRHQFPGMELDIREFAFHQLNANLLWPGTFSFAEWLMQHSSWIEGRRCLELGSGTGALAIFLRKAMNIDITTSDYNDQEIEENIAHNCEANGITPALPHIKHSWGDAFPIPQPEWDLIIASDILLYVKQYPNLIKSLSFLLNSYKAKNNHVSHLTENEQSEGTKGLPWPAFLMSWRRRIGKEDESLFFSGCENSGLGVKHLGSRVYCINLISNHEETD